VNLVIAATQGDWHKVNVISDKHPDGDSLNAGLVAELVAFTMALMRGMPPSDRAHILDLARVETDMGWIAKQLRLMAGPTFGERCGMYRICRCQLTVRAQNPGLAVAKGSRQNRLLASGIRRL
jgi:hypothetical protein